MIETKMLEIRTSGENDIVNITEQVQNLLPQSGSNDGTVVLFVQSTTSSLTIIEYEDGLLADFPSMMERLAPKEADYEHEKAWHDGNGHSHMRSAIVGSSLIVPFSDNTLLLGQWQQIVLTEFDVRPRKRTIVVQIITG